ncbi:T9SS type A sorting domain-containing protein, partial [candidate division KSB1 bacterium]|nr:T9SS type A sorting domain-containing protein [candidate division KSB1 bacterium]
RVLDGNPMLCLAMSATNTDTVFASTAPVTNSARVFRTLNGGLTWEDLTMDLPDRYPMDIAVDPTNSRNVYVVFSGFGTSHLFKSNDAGWSWIDIGADLPDVPSSAVTVDPLFPEHIYFGNDLGVYVSVNGGGTWQEWREGLPTAVLVMDLTISPRNRKLRVATHGNGVWERALLEAPDVSVDEPPQNVVSFRLEQNYPNPFSLQRREMTTIAYELKIASDVQLALYNVMGQEVARLQEGMVSAGRHAIRFDGNKLAAGAYFYRLRVGGIMQTKKMLVVE